MITIKIIPNEINANAIQISGSLKIDSVKITSWDPATNDYVKSSEIPRPFIRVNRDATDVATEITNSEIAYLGYACNGCTGLSFYGGNGNILRGNDIHDNRRGFYSRGVGDMIIEDNLVHNNYQYGLDPHTGTHDMVIRNNKVYDNGYSGIICSLDCHNITIEGNVVYNNGNNGT